MFAVTPCETSRAQENLKLASGRQGARRAAANLLAMLPWRVRSRRWLDALSRPAVGTRVLPIACATLLVAGLVAIGPAGDDGDGANDAVDPWRGHRRHGRGGHRRARRRVVGDRHHDRGLPPGGPVTAGNDASGGSGGGTGSTPGQAGGEARPRCRHTRGRAPAAPTPASPPPTRASPPRTSRSASSSRTSTSCRRSASTSGSLATTARSSTPGSRS